MRRRLRAQPKIARREDQPGAEMFQPDTVHYDAGGERIGRIRNGLGEFQSSASFLKRFTVVAGKHFQELSLHIRAFIASVAAKENMGVRGGWIVHQSHGAWWRAGV